MAHWAHTVLLKSIILLEVGFTLCSSNILQYTIKLNWHANFSLYKLMYYLGTGFFNLLDKYFQDGNLEKICTLYIISYRKNMYV